MPNPPFPVSGDYVTVNGKRYSNPIPGSKDVVPPPSALASMLAYIRAQGKSQIDSSWDAIPTSGTLTQKQNLVGVYFANVHGTAGTGDGGNGLPPLPGDAIKSNIGGIASGITSVTDFLKLLTDPNLWLRIAEVLLGALLLGVGVAKISTTGAKIVNMTPIRKLT